MSGVLGIGQWPNAGDAGRLKQGIVAYPGSFVE
jgi:hypothetical protein